MSRHGRFVLFQTEGARLIDFAADSMFHRPCYRCGATGTDRYVLELLPLEEFSGTVDKSAIAICERHWLEFMNTMARIFENAP